jgi:hypothetical protein
VEEREDTLENLDFAEFVLERWQIKERFQELKRVAGKIH